MLRIALLFAAIATQLPAQTKTAPTVASQAASEARWPTKDGTFDIPNFSFKDGGTLPRLHLHYVTLGNPHRNAAGHTDNAVLLLHGTGGDAHSLLNPVFSELLFGPGQPFDITKYFLILPDDIGHGESSKPSDGLRMAFPHYTYDDMVQSQHRMLLEGLHVDHLRLILGTSMGCMQAFVWGETFPTFSDALAPFACLPTELAGRNRMMRYMAIENIKRDPAWQNGNYTSEPALGLRTANEMLLVMGSSPLQMQKAAPTRAAAETYVDDYLARTTGRTDANNLIYYMDASRLYNPEPRLATITAPVLWINSADDYINPPELGIAERLVRKIPHARFILIPTSEATRGHGTHTQAVVWKQYLIDFLAQTQPHQAN
ncbi:MAG: alpha/beta fold hydrolase [Acidobacteriaceae bacterium]